MAYAPAGNLTTSAHLQHLAAVWYNRQALDQLMKKFRFLAVTEPDEIPLRQGKLVQWFRYSLLGANTVPSSEGTVGVSLQLPSSVVTATVSEYSDFLSVSTLLEETAIDPIVENHAKGLGYRGGLSVDCITRAEFDANTGAEISTLGAAASVADLHRAATLLKALDIEPRDGDSFVGIVHPYILYDIQSDNTAGGFIDISKYANPQILINGEEGKARGVRLVTSTNVKTSGTAPNVLYYGYIVGKGGVGSVDLAGRGPTRVADPKRQNFKINVVRGGPNTADPEGMIGSFVSYRYVYVAKTLDSDNTRFRLLKADASLV